MMHQKPKQIHVPVLLNEVLQYLGPRVGDSYLDLTAGYGGHAAAVLERTNSPESAVLVDRDMNAVSELKKRFGSTARLMHDDFASATAQLAAEGKTFDIILADLGVSSPHLTN